ncbi:MAG: hypothetical protein ACF8TS_05140, partial [Maioricimonas sp. JB049]
MMRKPLAWLMMIGCLSAIPAVASAQNPSPAPPGGAPPAATPPAAAPAPETPPAAQTPPADGGAAQPAPATPPGDLPADSPAGGQAAAATPVDPQNVEVVKQNGPGGQLQLEEHVFKDAAGKSIRHGTFTQYFPDGRVLATGDFVHGQRHGKWTKWVGVGESRLYASPIYGGYAGPFFTEAHFKLGALHGPWIVYDARKQKMSEWHFQDGVQHGPWIWYYPDGTKHRESTYVGGVLHGPVIDYLPNGQIRSRVEYFDGRRKYLRTYGYGYGGKQAEGWYLEPLEKTKTTYDWWKSFGETVVVGVKGKPVKHGEWTWWHPGGQVAVKGHYHLDEPIGRWSWLNQDGSAQKTRDFTVEGVDPPAIVDESAQPAGQPAAGQPAPAAGAPAGTPPAGTPPAANPPAA